MSKFKAVLFDLGGSLVKSLDPPEVHRRILKANGTVVSFNAVSKAHEKNVMEYDHREMAMQGQEYWVKWNLKFLDRLGIKENKEFLAQKIDEQWFEYCELETYPDAIQTLTKLKAIEAKTGIITNGLERDIKMIFQKLSLTSYFDIAIGADTCKSAKPDKEIFLYAARKLSLSSSEMTFIGNSLKYDYEGAKKAGLKPLLIDREGNTLKDVESITSLTEVLSYF